MKKTGAVKFVVLFFVLFTLIIPAYSAQVTLTVWAVDSLETTGNTQAAYVQALAKGFQAKYPDIKLDWVSFGTAGTPLADKLKVALANDQGPDIFQNWGGSWLAQYVRAGKVLDLTKELSDVSCSAAAKNAMSTDGKIYGVAPFFAVAGLLVNEGIFKKLGLKVPTTIPELEKVCDTLLKNGIQPFAVGAKDKWPALATYMYLVNRYGGDAFTQSAVQRKIRFDSDPFVKAAQKYQEWAKKGYFGTKPLAEGYGDAQLMMSTGKAAMQISGSWLCGLYSDPKQTDQTVGFYGVPTLPGGKGLATDLMGMTDIGFSATKTAESKKDAIVKFMKYAMSIEAISAETGRVSSVAGVKPPTRLTGMASALFGTAKSVQFWWDQDLPSTISGPVNDTIQSFYLPDTDVKKALSKYEEMLVDNVGPIKK